MYCTSLYMKKNQTSFHMLISCLLFLSTISLSDFYVQSRSIKFRNKRLRNNASFSLLAY